MPLLLTHCNRQPSVEKRSPQTPPPKFCNPKPPAAPLAHTFVGAMNSPLAWNWNTLGPLIAAPATVDGAIWRPTLPLELFWFRLQPYPVDIARHPPEP